MDSSSNFKEISKVLNVLGIDTSGGPKNSCNRLSSLLLKFINYNSKLHFLVEMKKINNIPPHILKPILSLESKFNINFLKSRRYNNQFFNNLSLKTLNLDIQQARWLIKSTHNKINNFLQLNHSSIPIENIISHPIFVKLITKNNKKVEMKLHKKINNNNKQLYTNSQNKNSTTPSTTTIISNNVKNCKIINNKTHHNTALPIYNNYHLNNLTINLSNKIVNNNIINFLSLGPNFAIPQMSLNKKDTIETIATIESTLTMINTSDNHKNALRNKINQNLNSFLTTSNKQSKKHIFNPIQQQIFNDFIHTKKWLNNNKDTLIVKTDKTKQTILIDKPIYFKKMMEHINNPKSYKQIFKNPTDSVNSQVKSYIKKLTESKQINKIKQNQLTNNNPITPRMYGLIKAHKENLPIRPIVNSHQSPVYNLSKFFNPFLNSLNNKNPYDIKNALQAKKHLQKIKLNNEDILISLDVISLYPNVPLDFFFEIINNKFNDHIKPFSTIKNKNNFLEGLKLCLNNSFFQFDNKFFKQTYGVPMGGCLSTNVSGIVLNNIIDSALSKLTYQPKIIMKYIDDLLLIINKKQLPTILNIFNSIHPRIQFTLEIETNKCINYLDMTIINNNNSLSTKWFKKEISSNRFLNFYSNHPPHMKTNSVKNLINKSFALTDPIYHNELKTTLTTILKENLYPLSFYNKFFINNNKNKKLNNNPHSITLPTNNCPTPSTSSNYNTNIKIINPQIEINHHTKPPIKPKLVQSTISQFFKQKTTTQPASHNTATNNNNQINTKNKKFIAIPYVKHLSENIKKTFKSFNFNEIKISDKPLHKLNNSIFSQLKDNIPVEKQNCIVYELDCLNCDKIYIGQTLQYINSRIKQHKGNCNSKEPEQRNKTALSKHATTKNHKFDFDNFKILDKEKYKKKREIKEALHIVTNNHKTVNDRSDMLSLNNFYASTLHNFKKK